MKKATVLILTALLSLAPVSALAEMSDSEVSRHAPISVERKNIDGKEYIYKTYEVDYESEPSDLEEKDFRIDGFLFAHESTEKSIHEKALTKDVVEEVKVETQTDKLEDILKQLSSTKEYSQDGYEGKIVLNTNSILTEVSGYTTKSYTISTTKEYPGLMYADPSYVSQTALKDGNTLTLTNIDWVVMGTGLAGDSLVPTEYKATATYAKTVSNQVPIGYVSTARYEGSVQKTEVDTVIYIITYKGVMLEEGMPMGLKVISCILLVALMIGSGFVTILVMKSRKNADIYNLVDMEYICIGKQAVDVDNPVIDLNEFDDMIQSNVFQIVLDKKTTRKLFGRNISVTLKDVTVKHRVSRRETEYSFDLDFGGVLDAE